MSIASILSSLCSFLTKLFCSSSPCFFLRTSYQNNLLAGLLTLISFLQMHPPHYSLSYLTCQYNHLMSPAQRSLWLHTVSRREGQHPCWTHMTSRELVRGSLSSLLSHFSFSVWTSFYSPWGAGPFLMLPGLCTLSTSFLCLVKFSSFFKSDS